jgi:predicted ArsR family transcriptional regulator
LTIIEAMGMDDQPNIDPIEQNLPWLNPWFTAPGWELLDLTGEEKQVLAEISTRWSSMNKVELFDSLGEQFGYDIVGRVIEKVVAAHIQSEWEELGLSQPTRTINDLIRILWEPLRVSGFDFDRENTSDGVQFHCTHCPHADLGRKTGASEWLYHLVCSGDVYLAAGFNPKIGFRRTQTLMEGHPCCNHFYFMKD